MPWDRDRPLHMEEGCSSLNPGIVLRLYVSIYKLDLSKELREDLACKRQAVITTAVTTRRVNLLSLKCYVNHLWALLYLTITATLLLLFDRWLNWGLPPQLNSSHSDTTMLNFCLPQPGIFSQCFKLHPLLLSLHKDHKLQNISMSHWLKSEILLSKILIT